MVDGVEALSMRRAGWGQEGHLAIPLSLYFYLQGRGEREVPRTHGLSCKMEGSGESGERREKARRAEEVHEYMRWETLADAWHELEPRPTFTAFASPTNERERGARSEEGMKYPLQCRESHSQ